MVDKEIDYDNLPPKVHFVESDIALSRKGVFRGIHYSPHCWKIYQCLHGAIYYVFVNCDEKDKDFGKWESFILKPYDQLLKHPRYGAGMLALEDDTILYYLQDQYYDAVDPDQQTFKYDDKRFNVWLPKITPELILSRRDEIGEYESRVKGLNL
jgi:dTDP-4-dehydrorhamnose 3,5-epimerase-like enzyme